MIVPIASLAIISFAGYVLWYACQQKWTIKIVVSPNARISAQGIPASRLKTLEEFFDCDCKLTVPVKIYGVPVQNRYLRLKFSGELSEGQRQQIRNFLNDLL